MIRVQGVITLGTFFFLVMNDFKYRLEIFGANVSRTTHTTTRNNFEFRHSAFPAVSRNVVELRI